MPYKETKKCNDLRLSLHGYINNAHTVDNTKDACVDACGTCMCIARSLAPACSLSVLENGRSYQGYVPLISAIVQRTTDSNQVIKVIV